MSRRPLDLFHPAVRVWFSETFPAPTRPQTLGWPAIARGESTLILAPTGSGKTLTAFLSCLNRLMFEPPPRDTRCRVLYVSPLKALASDIERNLQAPLTGIARVAEAAGTPALLPRIVVRTGDTPAAQRARFQREGADILITTPESLFLLLTSNARERLAGVDTVIVDEIHALVPTKRGAHLALSLERLEALRTARQGRTPLQRIGLSATQRPLDEVARFLGGARLRRVSRRAGAKRTSAATKGSVPETVEADLHDEFAGTDTRVEQRPVTIVNASEAKPLALTIELPIERPGSTVRSSKASAKPRRSLAVAGRKSTPAGEGGSIWASIHPRLIELIRSHQSTLLFVNSRRLAERLAGALNELAGEPLVRAHHGSLARETRGDVEALLKAGGIRGLVATSSLELGIDMGTIDLVVQIEAPPSVAGGLQRIGRAGHRAGALSEGIIFPKFRGDLVACAAIARAMRDGAVESTRCPRNPLDVLAQQIVAAAAMDTWAVDDLFGLVRCAAPYTVLSRRMFEGVLEMLSGRYPSDEFAELRPRVTWDRVRNTVVGREGARRVAVANAGTIPDRGLYGVFMAGAARPMRVGELDEEMVFETAVGDTFTLGASTWRVEEITHDRVLVSPAPGEPGKMPFWHGDRPGRPLELGYAIGRLTRELGALPRAAAVDRLVRRHDVDTAAAEILLDYLADQAAAGGVPDDRTIVIERCRDELGDWRVCLLSPLGSRIHAPWAMAAAAHIRQQTGTDAEVMWGDDGFVVRFPDVEAPPDPALLLPRGPEVERLVTQQLGATSLFAARFRETAARALLLPRRRPGRRMPLWQQRKRASDLLAVASRYGSFPALLETYREILRDYFDVPALADTLHRLSSRSLRLTVIDSASPSPFAASLLFSYVANYIYDGDAPLAERRAQALSVDQAQLRELLGDAELRDLLDPSAIESLERQLQHRDPRYRVRTTDALHDLLLRIGDLAPDEIADRSALPDAAAAIAELERSHRVVPLMVAGRRRVVAIEDAARYRDALAVELPEDLPAELLHAVSDPRRDLVLRYARTHAPFTSRELAERYGLTLDAVESILHQLERTGRLVQGEFRPGGYGREWVDADVLRTLRGRSLARLRREVEPVEPDAFARFLCSWHGIASRRRGAEALLDVVEQLQGAAVPASVLESEILPARIEGYEPAMLDMLMAGGEVVWVGVERLGERDGRIALYLTGQPQRLRQPAAAHAAGTRHDPASTRPAGRARAILDYLQTHGASFFGAVHDAIGGGFPGETVDMLWELVWSGLVTNDTLHPLRAFIEPPDTRARRTQRPPAPRSRRLVPPKGEGRWSMVATAGDRSVTEWAAALAQQLLLRHGVVTRETVAAEAVAGGFSAVYQVLKTMEEAGRVRRGYFVAGLGGAQFAAPGALDLLRTMRDPPQEHSAVILAATDPANPYGALIGWRRRDGDSAGRDVRRPTRSAGARVVLVDGRLSGYVPRGHRELLLHVPDEEPFRSGTIREVARALKRDALSREEGRRGMLLEEIDGEPAVSHGAARLFVDEGFSATGMGLQVRPDR